MRRLARLGLGLALGLAGCTTPSVEGSLSENMNLEFDRVELIASRNSAGALSAVSVRFGKSLGDAGVSEDVVLEVGARLTPTQALPEVLPGVPVDLAEVVGGRQRGSVYRSTLKDPNHTFPPLDRGQLTLDTLPLDPSEPGQRITGNFSVTFVLGTRAESGRTAFKTFEAIVP